MNPCENTIVVASERAQGSEVRAHFCQALALVAIILFLYHGIVSALVVNWWTDPNFSHGFFVPLFSFFVVWKEQKTGEDPAKTQLVRPRGH